MAKIIPFEARYLPDYVRFNRQWIEHYFRLEPMDLAQLEDPYTNILRPGGEILFLLEGEQCFGVRAMVPHGPGIYELAKMAVDPSSRGKGYGDLLMEAAEAWARARHAVKITLLSNTILEPAITLYKKHGFETVHLGTHPDYERSNIEMEKRL